MCVREQCFEGEKEETTSAAPTSQISHQAIRCIQVTCTTVVVTEMDKTIASLIYEKSIYFNVADSSRLARLRMFEESTRLAKQNPFLSYKAPSTNDYLGSSLSKHTSQLSNL